MRLHPLAIALAASIACVPLQAGTQRPNGGTTITVDNCDDSGPGSLRAAVASAVSGDFIGFAPSTPCSVITLTSGPIVIANDAEGQPFAALDIFATGEVPLTIDGGGVDRVIVHDAGYEAVLRLEGLTVTHGKSDASGGCILAAGSVLLTDTEVSSCVAGTVSGDAPSGNAAIRGGGVSAAKNVVLANSLVASNRIYGNASYAYGGGIFAGRSFDAYASTITNNLAFSTGGAAYGGGLAAGDRAAYIQSTVTLVASVVTNNTSDSRCSFCGSRGGGVWAYGNTSTTGGEIDSNTAFSSYGYGTGGGLYFNARSNAPPVGATIAGTDIGCNSADTGGGIAAGGDLAVSRALLSCNTASKDGGAIELFGGDLTLTDSTLVSNGASQRGAGVFVFGYGDATIVNSTITGNTAAYGAAIGNTYGSLHLANSTISGNRGLGHGGGIYFRYPYYPIDLKSTIVAGNDDGSGTPDDLWPPGLDVTGDHNLVIAADGVTLPGDTLQVDPLLLPIDLNGGPTSTMALAEGSPAIDAGSNPLSLPNDQRGDGYVRSYGVAPDIGAYEVQAAAPSDTIFADGFES
ncbi:MAG TPA: choice-of-anchor Q domain-containing protein [Rhodanobacteraceae bacterium]|nr:choice-of-anchor Q domain-containing protein [Rhodanobacteraceae bacterium]